MASTHLRNFSIIAHVDHGKSTLADRFLLETKAIAPREFHDQFLDDMELERERGITIKARAVRVRYRSYDLNLIDTPGHIDFTYEVSKSLAACEGVLLLVDSAQGVEAQTVTNLYLARRRNLVIIPVITKTDLANADVPRVRREIAEILQIDEQEILTTSAKQGKGITEVLDAIIERIPHPKGSRETRLKALVFDSRYDSYKGVVVYIRLMDGVVHVGDHIRLVQTHYESEVIGLGYFTPYEHPVAELNAGEVGYVIANIKAVEQVHIGDTVTHTDAPCDQPLPGYEEVKPMVFCGLYPVNARDYTALREALAKLRLNDASFVYESETSVSLGFGFRTGFLGLLHMDIIRERLEREFDLALLVTAPNVVYRIVKPNGEDLLLENPSKLPPPNQIRSFEEPFIQSRLLVPASALGAIMKLCQERRGVYKSTEYLDPSRVMLTYELPFAEIVIDFYDKVKSLTSGYGSLNYDFAGYRPSQLVRLDILINGTPVDALSTITVREKAYSRGKVLVGKLKDVIPRQLFEVVIQAAIGAKVIARDSLRPLGKNVTGKCYGGDITRKRKLWEKQKAGKKRMKKIGKVEIPQEAFISILQVD
ncbi:MAG: elongation factor 4 [Omnitrophica bacterium RIFCSPLOWO2_12_FULL_50_11]|nr:MAG: elongation factor 4 [Omnitrophica bacterium RIFCSPLOWO2_12_FULL_50_11]